MKDRERALSGEGDGVLSQAETNLLVDRIRPQYRNALAVVLGSLVILIAVVVALLVQLDIQIIIGLAFAYALLQLVSLAIYLMIRGKKMRIEEGKLAFIKVTGKLTYELGFSGSNAYADLDPWGKPFSSYFLYIDGDLLPGSISGVQAKAMEEAIQKQHADITSVTIRYVPSLSLNLSLNNDKTVIFDFMKTNPIT